MKKLLAIVLSLAMLLSASCLAVKTPAQAYLGSAMPDFTVTAANGETVTLSELLLTKKAVIITFWATWCGVCGVEFPYLEQAYEACGDEIAFIALSIEETDTPELIADYAREHGVTFPMASDNETAFADIYANTGVPVTVAVDRFGNIALLEAGRFPSAESVMLLCDMLRGDDYTQTVIITGYPGEPEPDEDFAYRKDVRGCIGPDCD